LGYLASEELQDGEGVRVAMSRQYYDGPAFQGLPLGQVQRGNLSRTESWIEADRFAAEEASEFDEHGNQVALITARGGRQEYTYDEASRTHVTSEKRFSSPDTALTWSTAYDARFGTLLELTTPSGALYSYRYDPLGRLTTVVKPGD